MYEIDKINFLQIGVQGENIARKIEIDMTKWVEDLEADNVSGYSFGLIFKPYNDPNKYPMVTTYDEDTHVLTWRVSAAATQVSGVGYTEVRAQEATSGLVKKTRIIPTAVEDSVSGNETEPPASQEEWVSAVLNSAAAVLAISQGKQVKFEIDEDTGHLMLCYSDDEEVTVDTEWTTVDLGAVNAYAMAVLAGYTGTAAQFEQYMAYIANGASAAAASAADAAASAADALQHTQSVIETWLDENLDPITANPPLDASLSLSNAAAPANLVGDLKSSLNLSTDTEIAYFTDGYYIKTNVSTGTDVNQYIASPSSSETLGYAIMNCHPGDIFTITGTGGNTGRLYAFIDSNGKMLDGKAAGGTSRNNETITAPASAAKVIFNAQKSGRGLFCKGLSLKNRFIDADMAIGNSKCMTKTRLLQELLSPTTNGVANGKMSSSGSQTSADDHLISRVRFQVKAGSYFQLKSNSDLLAFSVAVFDAQTGGNLLEILLDTETKYIVQNDGYARIDVKVDPETRTRSQILQLDACIIQSYEPDRIAFVSSLSELIQAIGCHKVIHLTDDIVVGGEIVIMNNDSIVYGYGHKISGTASISNYIQHWEGYHEWHDVIIDAEYTTNCGIKPNGTAIVKFYNCEIYGTDGDGIAPSGSSEVYCYNCKLHDNADEGFSSHDSTYCELYDCEVYHNAYIPFTDEPSEYNSYGGIHLGGSHVGVVQNCYAHHNRGGGINLAPLGQGDLDENMRAYVINNVSSDNVRNGIRLEGLFNCRVIGNTVINNGASGWGGIRVWVGQNTGESTTTSGIIAKNAQALNGVNTVQIDTGADGGITVVE